jgi:hypothetical protein
MMLLAMIIKYAAVMMKTTRTYSRAEGVIIRRWTELYVP